jgi:predicted component of viral defense system (DUF524 family)
MDTLLTGSNVKLSNVQELICVENERLTLTIKGKASHPNSNIEIDQKISAVKGFFATDNFCVSIYSEGMKENIGKHFVKKIAPLFFEQRNYEICIEYDKENPSDEITFWNDNVNIREKITPTGKKSKLLSGVINFGNEIGLSSFSVRLNGRDYLKLEIEVFPAKLDYRGDYHIMLQDVTDEVYNLAFDFLRKTYQEMDLVDKYRNSDSEFFNIISMIFNKMLQAADMIISHAHHRLEIYTEQVPVHKVKRIDNASLKWMEKHPERAHRVETGKVRFEVLQTTKKHATYDTYENKLVKFILLNTYRRLDNMKVVYLKVLGGGRKKDVEIVNRIDKMCKELHRRTEFTFLKQVGKLNESQSMSLVFAMAPGYKELYKYYLMLQKGLSLHGEMFHISMKDTALLYEYWCFIKLNNILKNGLDSEGNHKYQLLKQDILKVDRTGLTVTLKKGNPSRVEYLNPVNGEKMELSYNPKIASLPTVTQKPDNVLSLSKRENGNKYEYVFDAKYRINMAEPGSDYARDFKTPGPELDTINAMHRYRDAIVCGNGMDKPYERRMYGAYVLFPYDNETEYVNHQFFESIEKMNIGGLPFLPGTTSLVEKFLDELIIDSADSAFERATLPSGIEEKLKNMDLTERNVLVGLLSNKEQLDICLKNKFYHIPAKAIADDSFPFDYIAIHQTKELFGKDAGIIYYGKIRRCKKLKRSAIKEVPITNKNNTDEPYYYFDIVEWKKLDKKIEVDRMRRSYYTNIHLLQYCKYRPELSLTSVEQLRLYTELKRLSASVLIKDNDNVVDGFEFNGSYISFDGDEINVYTQTGKNKRYLASHLSRCLKATFNEIKDDVGCI